MRTLTVLGVCSGLLLMLPALASAQSASCPVLTRSLALGSQGEDVRALQRFLTNEGELISGSASGNFGLSTEKAVKGWQWSNRIVTSKEDEGWGLVGPKTRAAINARCKVATSTGSVQNTPYYTPPPPPVATTSVSTGGKCAIQAPKAACASSWQGRRGSDGCVVSWYCIAMTTRSFTSSTSTTFATFPYGSSTTTTVVSQGCTSPSGATVSNGQTYVDSTARYVCTNGQWFVTENIGSTNSTSTYVGTSTAGVGSIFKYWCPNGVGGSGYWSQSPCATVDAPPDFNNPTNLGYTYGSSANVKVGQLCAPEGRQEFIACPYMQNCFQGGSYLICKNAVWTPFN